MLKKRLAFIAIDIACFLTVLDSTIVNVSLPNMAEYFNTTTTGISWVSTAYLIAFSSLLINFSKIADIYGRKRLFLIGLFLFGISSACCGLADSLPLLIACRIMQGVGAAILTPLAIPLGVELFGKEALGKLSVIVGLTISISAALGPVIGGLLNEWFTYRAIFYINIPFVIVALVLGTFYVKECYDESVEKKIDFLGCLLLFVALGTFTLLLVRGNEYGWGSNRTILLGCSSVLSAVLFAVVERNSKNPMIDFKLFQMGSFSASSVLIAVFFYAYMPISYLLNFFFENTLGYSVLKAGLMMGIPSLTALLVTPLMPFLSKKASAKVISFLTVLIAVIGNLLLVFMNSSNHMLIICTSFVLMGIGVRIATILYQTAYEEISKDQNAMASGIQNSMRQLTACIAIAFVATLSTHYTTIATDHTKVELISDVTASTVLDQSVKDAFITAASQSTDSVSLDDSKEMVHTMLAQEEQVVLSALPSDQQSAVTEQFSAQEAELDSILEHTSIFKEAESYRVYNKCFFVTGMIALLGMIAVPFNHKKRNTITMEVSNQ
ncbi:MAG: multidrug transporter [Oscillospiraceae bacterium]|nr:multidrug transporter [Oscillospiraceae bacterium]